MKINNQNVSPELISKAKEIVKSPDNLDGAKLQELKKIALKDGKLTKEESAFISNLDNQSVLNKILSSNFNPKSFSFDIDKNDKTLTLSNNSKLSVGEGQKVFKNNGKIDVKSITNLSQRDNNSNTIGDNARCSCNASIVGLAMQGKDKLLDGMLKTLTKYISENADKMTTPEYLQKVETLGKLIADTKNGNLTSQDINNFASVLYDMYDTDKNDDIMSYEDVQKMQKDIGLNNGEMTPVNGDIAGQIIFSRQKTITSLDVNSKSYKDSQKEVAEQVISGIGNGKTVTVGVFNGNGADKPNHFVLVGKDDKGKVFIYNSDPSATDKYKKTYLEGDDAKKFLASKIGLTYENEVRSPNMTEYDLKVAAPVIK